MQIKQEKCEPSSNSYRVVNITAEASSGVATEVETPTGGPGKKRYIFQINQQKNFPPPPSPSLPPLPYYYY